MQKKDYLDWLIKWFSKKILLPPDAINRNFFTEGWLDSFQTIELISAIEVVLRMPLPNAALSDPRFISIIGLAEILSELSNESNFA